MRRITLFFSVFCLITTAKAQNFYVGVEAGPKWSFNKMSGVTSDIKTYGDMSARVGARAGYILNDELRFETGLYYNPFSLAFEFSNPTAYFSDFTMSSIQIPLRVKKKVYTSQNVLDVYVSAGVVPNMRLTTIDDLPWDSTLIADGTGDSLVLHSSIMYNSPGSFLMAELGVSFEYRFKKNMHINFNITGQTSFNNLITSTLSYTRNGSLPLITNFTTKGMGAFAEIGFIYLLSP